MALITTEAAGAYLAISPRTIRQMIKRGDLPAVRVGNNYRIDEADIQEFIHRNRIGR